MLFGTLFITWLIFNGKVNMEVAVIGILICGGITYFAKRFLLAEKKKWSLTRKRLFSFLQYGGILFWEIIKSNIAVIKLIWTPDTRQWYPKFVRFTSELEEVGMRVVLANSMTLTPGTITVGMEEKEFIIHVLDNRMESAVAHNAMTEALKRIERGNADE